jgi:hypothetical protein
MNAMVLPTCTEASATRKPPTQSTTTMPRFTGSEMTGPNSASALRARVEAVVSSRFATANRRTSCSSRPKAFTTRMPPRYSRATEFTPSIPSCTRRKRGNPVSRLTVMSAAATGTTTASTSESRGSRMTAITRLPTATMGAFAKMRISPFTNAWTWVTSLVCRVMSEAVSNRSSSSNENDVILRKRSSRRRAAKRNETRPAMTLRPIAPRAPIPATPSIDSPRRRTTARSRELTPSSMIRAMMVGCCRSQTASTERQTTAARKGRAYRRR